VAATTTARIPFQKINLIEYGQDVGRRIVLSSSDFSDISAE